MGMSSPGTFSFGGGRITRLFLIIRKDLSPDSGKAIQKTKVWSPLSLILWGASQGLDRNKLRITLHTRPDMECCTENRRKLHNQCTSGKGHRNPSVVETANFPQRTRKHFRKYVRLQCRRYKDMFFPQLIKPAPLG